MKKLVAVMVGLTVAAGVVVGCGKKEEPKASSMMGDLTEKVGAAAADAKEKASAAAADAKAKIDAAAAKAKE